MKDRNMLTARHISFKESMGRYAEHITENYGRKYI
jgi:hypothetical protein